MPVKHNVVVKQITDNEFYSLDYKIMELVFSLHKDLGRFYDEKIYQNELAYRCKKIGIEKVETEIPIQVSYKDFTKYYYMDLLVNNSVIYELKTVEALTGKHQKQALNYILMVGMRHGKLVNMRTSSVQHRFVSTNLTTKERYKFTIDDRDWNELDKDSIWLKQLMENLLTEWGAFLDTNLFYSAVTHFKGGKENLIQRIKIMNDSRILGTQKVHLLNSEIAFKISAVTNDAYFYEEHLKKFLNHTSIKAIQWINFNIGKIIFKTIFR